MYILHACVKTVISAFLFSTRATLLQATFLCEKHSPLPLMERLRFRHAEKQQQRKTENYHLSSFLLPLSIHKYQIRLFLSPGLPSAGSSSFPKFLKLNPKSIPNFSNVDSFAMVIERDRYNSAALPSLIPVP